MRTQRKYIAHSNLPPRFAVTAWVVAWLALDRYDGATWAWALVFFVLGMDLVGTIVRWLSDASIDVLEDR